jgi:hypothetical protein
MKQLLLFVQALPRVELGVANRASVSNKGFACSAQRKMSAGNAEIVFLILSACQAFIVFIFCDLERLSVW